MTSADVVYSLNHHRGEKSKSGAKGLVKQIDDIKADGKYEVAIKLKGGNADFPYILNDYHMLIAPEGYPSQIFVRSEIIDKTSCFCQSKIMIKTLGNFVLFIWSKFKVTSNLAAENLALRQQLAVMKRTNKRPEIRMADRLFWVFLSRIWSPWRKSLVIVKPDTVVRWHRKGFACSPTTANGLAIYGNK